MCIKCHVTSRVSCGQTLGDAWALQSQAERNTVASLMMDTVAKKQGAEEELRNSAMQTLTYEEDERRRQGYKEFCFSHLIIPPSPQDRPALVDDKDTPLYTTLPLHMTGWWDPRPQHTHCKSTPPSLLLSCQVWRRLVAGSLQARAKNEGCGGINFSCLAVDKKKQQEESDQDLIKRDWRCTGREEEALVIMHGDC